LPTKGVRLVTLRRRLRMVAHLVFY
jgi:hypothetical protein